MQLKAVNLVGKICTEATFAPFTRPLLGAAVLAVFLLAMLAGGANLALGGALAVFGGSTVVVASGEVLLQLTRLQTIPARLAVAIVVGVVATSIFLLLGVLLTGFQAGIVFLGLAAVIAPALIAVAGRTPLRRPVVQRSILLP